MTKEALKLALEALETGLCYVENEDFDNKQKFRGYEHLMPTDAAESIQEIKTAITAIKEALAQPEQEPVLGTKTWFEDGKVVTQHLTAKDIYKDPEQPEQEPVAWMRDDEMKAMVSDEKRAWILCGRSELIEEYNKPLYTTPPQPKEPEQEPVACVGPWHDGRLTLIPRYSQQTFEHDQPLYTTPPQRTWVGLTPEEVEACIHHVDEDGIGLFDFAEAIEAKLREKNSL